MPVVTNAMSHRGPAGPAYKAALGVWLKQQREAAGLTQKQLARLVGMSFESGISAIELGRNAIPPERLLAFADALGHDPRVFAARVLRFTHPHAYALLLENDPRKAFKAVLEAVPERVGRRMNSAAEADEA